MKDLEDMTLRELRELIRVIRDDLDAITVQAISKHRANRRGHMEPDYTFAGITSGTQIEEGVNPHFYNEAVNFWNGPKLSPRPRSTFRLFSSLISIGWSMRCSPQRLVRSDTDSPASSI
jgi:hypothetical protein